jgi:CO/xanthine dehydrogenase FAD-binding subunit
MQEVDFYRADTLDDLYRLLAETGGRVIAGGTDALVQMQRGAFPAVCVIDASRIADLRYIREDGDRIEIGALTTYADLLASALVRRAAPSLIAAAETVGAPQTRARGTLGGNIANASPAGDMLPPLLALDAAVTLGSAGGARTLPLSDVLRGPRQTCLEPGEIIASIAFRRLTEPSGSAFIKLSNRRGMSIAVVSAAAALALDSAGRIAEGRVALGAVAPTAIRSAAAEAVLVGQAPGADTFRRAARAALDDIAPISDVRATAAYRRSAAERLVISVLNGAWEHAGGRAGA